MIRISHFQITTSFKTRDSIIWIFNRRKMYERGRVLNKLFTLCSILRLAWTNVTVGRMFIFQVGQLLLKIQYTSLKKTCQVTIVTKQPGMINHCLYSLLSSSGTQPEMKLSCPKPQSANKLCCSLGSQSLSALTSILSLLWNGGDEFIKHQTPQVYTELNGAEHSKPNSSPLFFSFKISCSCRTMNLFWFKCY